MYHSEHGQDRWLEENIFRGKRHGVFVELGALDGTYTSNTLFFERERDWAGLLIEANPAMFCKMLQSGRLARKVLAAVGSSPAIAEFALAGISGWSGLSGTMDARHRHRIVESGWVPASFDVAILDLEMILMHHGITRVDYLSLDVEGAELDVLRGINFTRCDIDVLDIENNYGEPAVEEFMAGRGYHKIHSIEINDIYRRP